MPSTSTLTASEKALVKKHAPIATASDKVLCASIGRIYYAWPDPAKWSYSGISGAIVYGWGTHGGWLKVVDLAVSLVSSATTIRAQRGGSGTDGNLDGTTGYARCHLAARGYRGHAVLPGPDIFPHFPWRRERVLASFAPCRSLTDPRPQECMIGIVFSSESEAAEMFKKIAMRYKHAKKSGGGGGSSKKASSSTSGKKKKGAIDKSMIGRPTDFSHVAHMGFDIERGFSSTNVDPSWERLLGQLEAQGISRVGFPFSSCLLPTLTR